MIDNWHLPRAASHRYTAIMEKLMLILLALLQPAPAINEPAVTAFTDIHKRDLSCVAILAIVASEQERGIESALTYPLLSERGRTYAGQVGERVMAETGQSREQVRDAILKAVAAQQAMVKKVAEPEQVVAEGMEKCLPLLDTEVAPKPKPTLNQCAAMLQLAYETVYAREKLSKTAQDLKTLAFVLDSRAREKMRGEGKSGSESDIILTQTREEVKALEQNQGKRAKLDIDHCFALAAPEKKGQNFEH
ncbi:hypothetical protein [Parasphingorhabdus cellanae]|uniref:Uncharacterized protein n=1 Tax=Parasphingorhabdus cellanae TaxID=2806553 RepID=A0ABX7T3E1_9SPHN|nr:hypothetical protein [Parasphingorhabdus cellanae]QTD55067.1 hypothetical protein J4G78_12635 [Parasphingorhabdus cellanae]